MSAMRPMGKPRKARMLYYDDARHAYLYTVEPPPDELDVLHPATAASGWLPITCACRRAGAL